MDNFGLLAQCLASMLTHTNRKGKYTYRLVLVNNGTPGSIERMALYNDLAKQALEGEDAPDVLVLEDEVANNRGWEGGLLLGLEQSESPYVMFLNDDTHFLANDPEWLNKMCHSLDADDKVAAVGPTSNIVLGYENIFNLYGTGTFYTQMLIGFAVLVRRKALMEVGGVASKLPGGDDLDLSMRFTKNGWKMVIRTDVFIYHYGFLTGTRVHGNYWNSVQMGELTRMECIRRNGVRAWVNMFQHQPLRFIRFEEKT
jgi:GT2 family glycosyltransferase